MANELIMYTRTAPCPFVTLAKRVLSDYTVSYREVFIDKDDDARERVVEWTGFLSVPTLVVAETGSLLPFSDPSPLPRGASPRGIDRGAMLTEPSSNELARWLLKHGFIDEIVED
jgi:glutaredoxin